MKEIRELIKEWIESWTECEYCNHMIRNKDVFSDNHDNPICSDCMLDEFGEHTTQ